jgi:hypothetical protein
MLIIMAVVAEIFPVAAIGRIVVVVPITMMHRQEIQISGVELATAFGTDRTVNFE